MNIQFLSATLPVWAIAMVVVFAVAVIAAALTAFFTSRKKAKKPLEEATPEPAVEPAVEEPEEEAQPEPVEEPEVVAEEEPAVEPEPAVDVTQPEPEPEPEPVVEETQPEPEPEPVVEPTADPEADEEEEISEKKIVRQGEHVRYIIIKYKKSFTAKLIQSDDDVKNYYSELKNELLSYKGVKARMSWKYETFYSGRVTLARIALRGKCPCVFFALNPKDITDEKYIIDDMSEVAAYEKTPTLYRIKNDRRLRYSKELIATVMGEREKLETYDNEDWASKFPYEKIEPLIERGLVKVLTEDDAQSGDVFKPRDYVQASEVDELMQDEVAVALTEESDEISDRTKSGIINIDTLSKYFEDGETVTLEEIKKRISDVPARTTYIKVLARGTLDKKLTVIADHFSIQAAKMILLTGGYVIKKKNV